MSRYLNQFLIPDPSTGRVSLASEGTYPLFGEQTGPKRSAPKVAAPAAPVEEPAATASEDVPMNSTVVSNYQARAEELIKETTTAKTTSKV